METRPPCIIDGHVRIPLETSLVEWKLGTRGYLSPLCRPLETSLVEWKHRFPAPGAQGVLALETSLVEWKPVSLETPKNIPNCLGNFLSGMETPHGCREVDRGLYLGNFLSGMETGARRKGYPDFPPLGNFLSGMETKINFFQPKEFICPWKLP